MNTLQSVQKYKRSIYYRPFLQNEHISKSSCRTTLNSICFVPNFLTEDYSDTKNNIICRSDGMYDVKNDVDDCIQTFKYYNTANFACFLLDKYKDINMVRMYIEYIYAHECDFRNTCLQ